MNAVRLSVLVSGRGTNLRALLAAIDAGHCPAQVTAVLADREQADALAFARERGVATLVVRPKDYPDRTAWDAALCDALAAQTPDLVVLAGFMRLIGSAVLTRYENRVVNVHPSLLPAFPGMDAPVQALAKGVSLSGCTVHLVDSGVDSGPILAQAAVPVMPGDDAVTLHARIQAAEHRLLPHVVSAIAKGQLRLPGRGESAPRWQAREAPAPLLWPQFDD